MTYLFDVNVLVALLDGDHVHNHSARIWFETLTEPWATCPVTEMGVARILSLPEYPRGMGSPAAVIRELEKLQQIGRHEFWGENLSLVASPAFNPDRLRRPKQITDSYLLALAADRQGKLASFDKRLNTSAVGSGATALFLIPS